MAFDSLKKASEGTGGTREAESDKCTESGVILASA